MPDKALPLASGIGIKDTNDGTGYGLKSTTSPLPNDSIVKFDLKINTAPSQLHFSCKSSNDVANEKRVFLRSNGTFTFEVFQNGGGLGSSFMNWDKSPGIHHFELTCVSTSMILKEDNITLGNWDYGSVSDTEIVRFFYENGDSEFANYQLCDAAGCDAPSPTPSPTPTPTPIPVTKVVVVPGLGGSWNGDAITNCKSDNYSGPWVSHSLSNWLYGPLISALNGSGFTAEPFYYDWRKQMPDTAPQLKDFINTSIGLVPNEKTHIVGHSLGGLVGGAYIELEGEHNRADKYMGVGAPYQGALPAYPAWSAGDIDGNLLWRMMTTRVIQYCRKKYPNLNNREIIQTFFPSVQNLLPTFDYLKDAKTGTIKPVASMSTQNNWLPRNLASWDTWKKTLSGFGIDTPQFYKVKSPSKHDTGEGNWIDGKIVGKKYDSLEGDGTVLATSSMMYPYIPENNIQISRNHLELVYCQDGINQILQFLTPTILPFALPIPGFCELKTTPYTALEIIAYPANFSVTINGKSVKDSDGIVSFINPASGNYTLHLQPKTANTKIVVAQYLENKTLWREYQWNSTSVRDGIIQFNPSNPLEDPLK